VDAVNQPDTMARGLSFATVTVLHAIARGYEYGFDVIDATGLPSGTVYPALSRLERDGYLRSDWEDESAAHADKRPPRRYYRITAPGVRALEAAVKRYRALGPVRRVAPARGR
jgi:PadR family transcriptional regulator